MKIKKSSHYDLTYALGMLIAISFLASCITDKTHEETITLDLGKIDFNPKPDTCWARKRLTGKCYKFTSSSAQVFETKTGVLRINEPEGEIIGTIVTYSGGLGTYYKQAFNSFTTRSCKSGVKSLYNGSANACS